MTWRMGDDILVDIYNTFVIGGGESRGNTNQNGVAHARSRVNSSRNGVLDDASVVNIN